MGETNHRQIGLPIPVCAVENGHGKVIPGYYYMLIIQYTGAVKSTVTEIL